MQLENPLAAWRLYIGSWLGWQGPGLVLPALLSLLDLPAWCAAAKEEAAAALYRGGRTLAPLGWK